jgi:hypothetical protein
MASLALFLASLPVLALQGNPPLGTFTGWDCLTVGWAGVQSGYLAWLANLVYLPLLVSLGRRRRSAAIVFGALFLTLALLSFQFVSTALNFSRNPQPEFERLGPGFWLWLSSGVPPLAAAMSLPRRRGLFDVG